MELLDGSVSPRLGVARANALQAKTSHGADADAARTRALATYKDFLALCKDVDPDIPILKEAKAEYAKLQQPSGFHPPTSCRFAEPTGHEVTDGF